MHQVNFMVKFELVSWLEDDVTKTKTAGEMDS